MEPTAFDKIQQALATTGPDAAIKQLCELLREQKDYNALFYALLLQKRYQLGVSPVPTGPSSELPEAVHGEYEEAIRSAGRLVGDLYREERNLPQAWAYYRMLGEPESMRSALDADVPEEGEDIQSLVQIAYYDGIYPQKGFDWILERFGLCNAITTIGSSGMPQDPVIKQYCIASLVRALDAELRDRLTGEIARREGQRPPEASAPPSTPGTVPALMNGRDWLFEEDSYYIDISHLSSVVQMSLQLTPGKELRLARDLCAYGARLSERLQGPGDPPFEKLYESHAIYLAILDGDKVEEGLAYFHAQADNADPETIGTYPAELLVNLLLRLDRPKEALAVARKHLAKGDGRRLSCPGVSELCQKVGDYRTLAEVAREQGDAVHYLAGLLAGKGREG